MQLNPQQQQALMFPADQSALIIAGAGSGKTTVIAHRAIRLLGLLPGDLSIQMLTFSNKAAKEMKERVRRLGGANTDRLMYDTFHSWGLKRLKDDPQGFGLEGGFTLLMESDTARSVRALAKRHGLPTQMEGNDRKRLNPSGWLNTWSLARQAGYDVMNPQNRAVLCDRLIKAHGLEGDEIELAWSTLYGYEIEKQSANSVDFDDLLYRPLLRLAKESGYAEHVRAGIGHVLVDEVQDTNRIQYEMVRRWLAGHCPVTAVGDDDQSVYGWRGAEVSNVRRFVQHFGAMQLRLEQNYRSTQSIVNSATSMIRLNVGRLDKSPFSTADIGEPPSVECVSDSRAMSELLCSRIGSLIESGVSLKEIAVLYRTNRMAMLLEQSLRRHGIPYHVVGGMSLFDRAEVVAVTSAIRLALNPRDCYALKNLIPYIDGVGAGSGYLVQEWMEADPARSMHRLREGVPGLSEKRLEALSRFFGELTSLVVSGATVDEFIDWVVAGPMQVLERETNPDMRKKREAHLNAMREDIKLEIEERSQSEPDTMWVDVIMDAALREARQSEAEAGQITLSTIHRAKGLEWDHVFIAGSSEGLMPLEKRTELDEDDAGFSHVEEERRLAFVGVTRARKSCTALHADSYAFPGSATHDAQPYEVSRFVAEMGAQIVDHRYQGAINETDQDADGDDLDTDALLASIRQMMPGGM